MCDFKKACFSMSIFYMMPRFARPVTQLRMTCNEIIHWFDSRWGFKLTDLNQQWLTPQNLMSFPNSIYQKGAALDNVWGFVDCTLRGIARPVQNQRVTYNGHKRKHGLNYQSITTLMTSSLTCLVQLRDGVMIVACWSCQV